MSCLVPFKPFYSTRQHWTNGLARLSQLALSFRPFGCSDCLQSSNLLDASLDPFWLSAGFNTVVCLKWRHQQSRFEQVECRNGFMSLVKHSLLSIASTPSQVVKQVLASIESQEVFNSKDMFDGLTRQTDCLALLKVSGSGLLFSTASCLCCSRGLSIGVGSQLWGHRRHTALTALQGVLGFLLFSRHTQH